MKISKLIILVSLCLCSCLRTRAEDEKLKGEPISSDEDGIENAFDGNLTTEFKSTSASNGWIGLDLSSGYKITKIGWAQKSEEKSSYLLGIFEGANDPSFDDAIPLYMITEEGKAGEMNYINIDVTTRFRYIRYIGPNKKNSVIAGFEVYGTDIENDFQEKVYQPTNIPLVVIHTENAAKPPQSKEDINCYVSIIVDGKVEIATKATISVRGNSTSRLEKGSYRIKFPEKTNVLGMPATAKKWTLLANHMDKTLMRNLLAFKVSSLFGAKYAPACKSVDVMFNGEFQGNYILCDQVEVGKNRIDITEMDETCVEEPEISGGYFLEAGGGGWGGRNGQKVTRLKTTKGINYVIKYPDEEDITEEQTAYIKEKFDQLEEDVYNEVTDNFDLDSFFIHFLTQEYTANIDCMHGNYYFVKEREDDKFYMGPVWDFDLSLDNDGRLYPTNEKEKYAYKYGDSAGTLRDFVLKLLGNEEILQALKDKWADLVKTKNPTKVLTEFIEETAKNIDESQKLNFLRWDILNKKVMFDLQGRGSYEAEVDILKEFIAGREESLGNILKNSNTTNVAEGIESRHGGWGGGNHTRPDWGNGTWPGGWGNRTGRDNWTWPGGEGNFP